jgi:hypothetical protein
MMIPIHYAVYIQRHSLESYIPFLALFILEVMRYQLLQSYYVSISHESEIVNDPRRKRSNNLHEPLLVSNENDRTTTISGYTAKWWNSDYWNHVPPRHSHHGFREDQVQLAILREEWATRTEIDGPYWWSRDEEDIERDIQHFR